ncbi:thiol reductant ABC exporter subunit CydD [Roseibium sp. FZY0029]|uniref:thiol reductant ABC exporter subunit CydD n=1 Tax=Roseibium sp. FZY0029 TaxID=3116647 RepID=UPI002EA5298C|nr:thiol reductant ABC exporter subunit CydD [Roseibium sp. FZY0029]
MKTKKEKIGKVAEDVGQGRGTAAAFGWPNEAESRRLKRAGKILAVSDLLWIAQAGLISWALGPLPAIFSAADASLSAESDLTLPALLAAAGIALVALLRVFLQNRAETVARQTARAIQSRARGDLLSIAATRSPSAAFPSSGAFAAHVTEQVDLLGPYYRNFEPQKLRLRLVPLGIVAASAVFSWLGALILIVCGPLIPVFMALIGLRAKAASERQQEELVRLSGSLLDRIKGLETLMLFGAIERTQRQIGDAGERFRTGTMRVLKIAFLSSTVLELFSALGIAFCAVYVGFSLLGDIQAGTWGEPLTFAQGLFILLLAPEFFAPLRAYAAAYHDRAGGLAARERLATLFPAEDNPKPLSLGAGTYEKADARQLSDPPAIEFRSVCISHQQRDVFKDFSLAIKPAETLLLEGPSGSGKTTLIDGILGFHEPDSGEILVDDAPAYALAAVLRRKVIWLGQSPRLFHGSLRANLLKAVDTPAAVTEDDLWQALRLAGAETLVQRLPRGLETPLGEDGFGLSVGEIRRVALARAAMRKDAVLLLADEPTASLDEETAADVISGLQTLCNGRTSIIATHDKGLRQIATRRIDLKSEGAVAGGRALA